MLTRSRRLGILLLVVIIGCAHKQTARQRAALEPPAPQREFRGVWVATVGNIDWPSKPGLSTDEQKRQAIAILDKCAELNLNAVMLQVRPACDALYDSKIEPWSYFLTGEQGRAPKPYYDPLKFWIEEAHKRGLELHAWLNPYRAHLMSEQTDYASNHVIRKHPGAVKSCGEYLWLDPGSKVAQDQTYRVFMDIVKRYDVDGMHIDDYFYPYPDYLKGKDFPDDESWAKYQKSGGKLARADWRRENVNQLIHRIYTGIKEKKRDVRFGISPFGLGHDRPEGVKGFDPYEKLYADAEKWWMVGWCDYLTPQLYWKISAPEQPFASLLQFWALENQLHRNLYAGLFTSRVGEPPPPPVTGPSTTQATTMTSDQIERWRSRREALRLQRIWSAQEIVDQIDVTRETAGAGGDVHFSMKAFMRDSGGIDNALKDGPYQSPSLIPPSAWLDDKPPQEPSLKVKRKGDSITASWSPRWQLFGGERPWLWVVHVKRGDVWQMHVYPGRMRSVEIVKGDGAAVSAVAVSQVDRCGNESERNAQQVK